jgi:hypothetical protein
MLLAIFDDEVMSFGQTFFSSSAKNFLKINLISDQEGKLLGKFPKATFSQQNKKPTNCLRDFHPSFSGVMPCWLGRVARRLICLVLILQAFGGQLLMGSGIMHEPTAVQSVVLVDSALIQNLPKEELVGSRIVPIEGSRDVISQITTVLNGLRDIRVLRVISHGSGGGGFILEGKKLMQNILHRDRWKLRAGGNRSLMGPRCSCMDVRSQDRKRGLSLCANWRD